MVVILIGLAGRSATRVVVMARNTARAPAQTHCRPMAAMTAHGLVVTKKCLLATMDLVKLMVVLPVGPTGQRAAEVVDLA